jgi:hypothetical protein
VLFTGSAAAGQLGARRVAHEVTVPCSELRWRETGTYQPNRAACGRLQGGAVLASAAVVAAVTAVAGGGTAATSAANAAALVVAVAAAAGVVIATVAVGPVAVAAIFQRGGEEPS